MENDSSSANPTAGDDILRARREKLRTLLDRGIEPFAARADVTHRAGDLADTYADLESGVETEDVVSIAGRLVAIRDQGKVAFLVLRDATGDLQLFCRQGKMSEDAVALLAELDLGDWIAATGVVVRTRRGELSVSPSVLTLLAKSLRPLPEKYHGLTDTETRYRQRYVDLIVNPDTKKTFETRFAAVASMRRFMEERGFIEVETPMLHPIPGGANARPFVTHHNALGMDLFLRIAPELYLKRLLVGGFERVFEVNRSFRNEGVSVRHNPEFTMLEAYQAFTDLKGMAELVESLVTHVAREVLGALALSYQGVEVDLSPPWRRATMVELVSDAVGSEVTLDLGLEGLRTLCGEHEVVFESEWGPGKLLNELFEKLVESELVQPTFVFDYPIETSPLARKKADDVRFTERFEVIVTGREIANAFSELIDPDDQRERFEAQTVARSGGDDEAMGLDEDYLRAMEYGMPPCGGLGIGIDRLVMLLTDAASIRDVLLFPHLRPEA